MTTPTSNKEKLLAYLIVDDIEVLENVLKIAQDDNASTFYGIGQIYEDKEKYDKAIDWYRLGASKGHEGSQFKLGYMHNEGMGVTVNYKLAMYWYLKAYESGDTGAATNVGILYYNGEGVNQDFKLALQWFLKAADSGEACAQSNIGIIYENGYGVKVDKQFALEWYEKSVEQGYEKMTASVRRLNDQGFYADDRQKRHLQTEKDLEAQKSKIESLENQLKALQQKQLATDKEIKLLKQESKIVRLKSQMGTQDQAVMKEGIIQNLAEVSSKMVTLRVSSNVVKGSKADKENPENDICYDD